MEMLSTTITVSMPPSLLLQQPTFLPYCSATSPFTSFPLRRNHSPIKIRTSSETHTTGPKSRTTTSTQSKLFSSQSQTAAVTAVEESLSIPKDSASDVIRKFYGGINGRALDSVEDLIAESCVYEDLVFPQPFVGRKAILEFFKKFIDYFNADLQFVIDDISEEDSAAVGVTWHLDWKGRPFPFSKGCSFYRLDIVNGKRQIIYARDSVEPSVKPGETALVAIRGVTWLFERFPRLVDML